MPASAQAHRRTVLDYFKMLPSKFFEGEQFGAGQQVPRMKWLREGFDPHKTLNYNRSIIDLKNDFLRFPGDGAQARLDVAVFRFHGQDIVGVADSWSDVYSLSFWRERNGHLREVTKSVFPFYLGDRDDVAFVVPQHGTTIRVLKTGEDARPTQTTLARFQWRNGRFLRA